MKIFALVLSACLAALAASAARSDAQSASAVSPSPSPAVVTNVVASGYAFGSRADVSNALYTFTRTSGTFRYGASLGAYAFPVVGQPLASAFGSNANTSLYGLVPIGYLEYAPTGHFAVMAGKLAALLGQEGVFTYQNVDIQRGLGWNMEPLISRGVRVAYATGKLSADVEINDGYYSGRYRAVEGLLGWAFDTQTTAQFAAIVPDANTPGNPTATIANKAEYNFMFTQTVGKLTVSPYVLLVNSPASQPAGYTTSERAWAAVMLASYAFNGSFSVAGRYERAQNTGSVTDSGANADLVGYGPGSAASTYTLTPSYAIGKFAMRAEYSFVTATPASSNTRAGLEMELQF